MAALWLAVSAALGCSGPSKSSRLAEGQPCRLDYVRPADRSSTVVLSIVNKSWKDTKSSRSGQSRVDDDMLSWLIGDFEGRGFFQSAQRGGPARPGGYLALHLPDGVWYYSQPGPDQRAQWKDWQDFLGGFTAVFSKGDTLFTVTKEETVDWGTEIRRIEAQNRQAKEKLMRESAGQGK